MFLSQSHWTLFKLKENKMNLIFRIFFLNLKLGNEQTLEFALIFMGLSAKIA